MTSNAGSSSSRVETQRTSGSAAPASAALPASRAAVITDLSRLLVEATNAGMPRTADALRTLVSLAGHEAADLMSDHLRIQRRAITTALAPPS